MLAGWVIGNPPFAGADEHSHYERVLGISQGVWIGKRARVPIPAGTVGPARIQREWLNDAYRAVQVPSGLLLPHPDCNAGRPAIADGCVADQRPFQTPVRVRDPVGNYQPEGYLAPALVVGFADNPWTADRYGRIATAIVCWLLIAIAVRRLWCDHIISLLGLSLALTPMALFVNAIINPSGLEIVCSIAFCASSLALCRRDTSNPGDWAFFALTGALTALSRTPGPVWVVLIVCIGAALGGGRRRAAAVRTRRRAALLSGLTVTAAIVANRIWEARYGSQLRLTASSFLAQLGPSVRRYPQVLAEEIGNFGSLDSPLALPLVVAWMVAGLMLVAPAVRHGTNRERCVLSVLVLLNPLFSIPFGAAFAAGSGFGLHGRHVLVLSAIVPLVAGEVLHRHRARLSGLTLTSLCVGAPAVVGVVQVGAWLGNARRQSVGMHGPLRFVSNSQWSPPWGWWPWIATVLLGATLLACAWAVGTTLRRV
ncbi:MAG TPA: DUF2142 domain-containing protein [Pseudonocardiaceae bacterium]|nr:DUF2142 domain-containing protein [Pseudonocardiaceae bacterium]